jgi:hypothetical protein
VNDFLLALSKYDSDIEEVRNCQRPRTARQIVRYASAR